ncbi:hypothetical protein E4U57_006659 [Claviceps arundinis]|uniref:Uncharacterized protein n=1 Tax=Claviceps arundinis TaxID=1623583 RepID=A0A9P7SQC2_9HYPO|nr:hypothetical protein E4U57_006659 [Claviceps arundinis]KAG5972627.1 hypothetical protein E4U56_005818 [Claviceps arundinis]
MSLLELWDWGFLRCYGLATDVNPNGFVKVHRALLTLDPDVDCPNTPLAPLEHVRTCYQPLFFESIPAWLISRATLEFIGFSEFHADKIWGAWLEAPESYYSPTGQAFLKWIIEGLLFPEHFTWLARDNDWRQIHMQGYGLNEETQQEIHRQTRDPNHTSNCPLDHSSHSSSWPTLCNVILEKKLVCRFRYLLKAYHLSLDRTSIRRYFGADIAKPVFTDLSNDARIYPRNSAFSRCLVLGEAMRQTRAIRLFWQMEAEARRRASARGAA